MVFLGLRKPCSFLSDINRAMTADGTAKNHSEVIALFSSALVSLPSECVGHRFFNLRKPGARPAARGSIRTYKKGQEWNAP